MQNQKSIREVKKHFSKNLGYEEICDLIMNFSEKIVVPQCFVSYEKDTFLYRARIVDSCSQLTKWEKSDFWEVPANLVKKFGRLNLENESIFYLSSDFSQTMKELRYEHDSPIVVSAYKVNKGFSAAQIGVTYPESFIGSDFCKDEEDFCAINMTADFFNEIFSQRVGEKTEYLYKYSNAVSKIFYDLPFDMSQAWSYNAVDNFKAFNVAFKNNVANKFINYEGSICLVPFIDNDFKVPFLFDSNYNFIFNDNSTYLKWINETFGIKFTNT